MKYRQTLILALGSIANLAMAQTTISPATAAGRVIYHVTDLGPVGNPPGQPYAIANNGVVAGAAQAGDGTMHAVLWYGGQMIDTYANRLGGPNSQANDLNDRGQLVGATQTSDANSEDFCGFNAYGLPAAAKACRPFVWRNGAITELPNTLGGANAVANHINNRGEVAGLAETSQPQEKGCPVGRFAPVIWRSGSMQALPTWSGDPDGMVNGINDNGQAVGATGSCAPFNPNTQLYLLESHAVLWDADGSVHLIPGFGGDGGFGGNHACEVNNVGQVVGHSDVTGDATFHGFIWSQETGTVALLPFAGDFASLAIGINDSGQVVGGSLDEQFNLRAMVWQNGVGVDLNSLVQAHAPLYLQLAFAINASGEIAGFGQTPDGAVHGFLATPNDGGNGQEEMTHVERRVPASESARKLLFQRIGIRER